MDSILAIFEGIDIVLIVESLIKIVVDLIGGLLA